MNGRSLGQRGEQAVAEHLEGQGYQLVARNARAGRLEIDLIASRDRLLIFCEVKTTRPGTVFGAQERLGRAQQQRLRRAAAQWLRDNPDASRPELRLDAAFVTLHPDRSPEIAYFEGAF